MKTYIALALVATMTVGCATTTPYPQSRYQAPYQSRVDQSYQSSATVHYGEHTKATVIEVRPIYESVVVGKDCNQYGDRVICKPVTQQKATATRYVAELHGRRFTGNTYRPLKVGDQVYVDAVVSLNAGE